MHSLNWSPQKPERRALNVYGDVVTDEMTVADGESLPRGQKRRSNPTRANAFGRSGGETGWPHSEQDIERDSFTFSRLMSPRGANTSIHSSPLVINPKGTSVA